MREFFNTYYVANNMTLIMVGDFVIEEIKPLIEEKATVHAYNHTPTDVGIRIYRHATMLVFSILYEFPRFISEKSKHTRVFIDFVTQR